MNGLISGSLKASALASALAFAIGGGASDARADCGEVSITEMNWASASVVTNVAKFVMEQGYGCKVTVVPSDTAPAATSLAENGEPDIVDFVSDINRARVLRVRKVMDKTTATDGVSIAGEIDQEENLETVIAMAEGDTRKTYLVKDGERKVGILRMDTLVKSLVPTEAADDGIRAR